MGGIWRQRAQTWVLPAPSGLHGMLLSGQLCTPPVDGRSRGRESLPLPPDPLVLGGEVESGFPVCSSLCHTSL